jgi:hypothetical protein
MSTIGGGRSGARSSTRSISSQRTRWFGRVVRTATIRRRQLCYMEIREPGVDCSSEKWRVPIIRAARGAAMPGNKVVSINLDQLVWENEIRLGSAGDPPSGNLPSVKPFVCRVDGGVTAPIPQDPDVQISRIRFFTREFRSRRRSDGRFWLAAAGEITPPCGEPSVVRRRRPSSTAPAFSHLSTIILRMTPSVTLRSRNARRSEWGFESKYLLMSISTTQ